VTPAITAPGLPTGISASGSNGSATVSFTAPSDGGSAITGYTVTATPAGGGTSITATGTSSPITVTGLTNGTSYTFTATATNAVGTSASSTASAAVTPAITAPGLPTGISASGSNGSATVSFTAPVDNGGSAITGYTVTATPVGGGTPITATGTSSPITVTGLTNGTSYTFTATATNAVGTGTSSTPSSAVTPAITAPGLPTGISATVSNGSATVSFTAPVDNGGTPITGYTVTATPAGGGTPITATGTSSPITVTGLTGGVAYTFTVTATNAVGAGQSSTASVSVNVTLAQTITFAPPADRLSNSGSFALSATASSGLPVSFSVTSGPALLSGAEITLTGVAGTVVVRASQPGNAIYNAAPDVAVTFSVTAAKTNVFFGTVTNAGSTAKSGDVAAVLPPDSNKGSLLVVAPSVGVNSAFDFTLNPDGTFTITYVVPGDVLTTPIGTPAIAAAPVTLTIRGSLVNGRLQGVIEPLGLAFSAAVLPVTGASANAAGFYQSSNLATAGGSTYSVVGTNNEVLVLATTPGLTTGGLATLGSNGSFNLQTQTSAGVVTVRGSVDAPSTTVTGTISVPGKADTNFAGVATTTKRTDRLIGLATRAKVGIGESVLIAGVAIGGTESKRVLIRAGGPALAGFGLTSTLPNPTLKIYRGSTLIAQNDDWNPADAAETARLGLFAFPNGSKDAAILTTLEPGTYTAQVSDLSGTGTGVALAEIYDASVNPTAEYQRLVSIASRGTVTVGDGALIGGFVVVGNAPKTLLIRGIGPTLTAFGVAGALADPVLTIYQDGEAIATNAGWANLAEITTAGGQAGAFALAAGSRDAALLVTLKPGAYTAQIKAAQSASSGVALIEIYEVP
jgi:hypothetical protein